jgi:hypothetical protein
LRPTRQLKNRDGHDWGIFSDFAHHVTSSLSRFITAAYEACEQARATALAVRLLPDIEVPQPFAADHDVRSHVQALRDKFAQIPGAHSPTSLDQITSLVIEAEFAPDQARVEERRRMMAAVPVYSGHHPVYRYTVSLRLATGRALTVTSQDP